MENYTWSPRSDNVPRFPQGTREYIPLWLLGDTRPIILAHPPVLFPPPSTLSDDSSDESSPEKSPNSSGESSRDHPGGNSRDTPRDPHNANGSADKEASKG